MKTYSLHTTPPPIIYGFHHTPFGECLVAITSGKVCYLAFLLGGNRARARREMEEVWPGALYKEEEKTTKSFVQRIFSVTGSGVLRVPVLMQGTPFQVRVWKELQNIPRGTTVDYKTLAERVGSPRAFRAVGTACGKNHIAVVVPCHRVVASDGSLGGYRWGVNRKKALLEWEKPKNK